MKKFSIAITCIFLILALVTGCGKVAETETEAVPAETKAAEVIEEASETAKAEETTEAESKKKAEKNLNYLTGLNDLPDQAIGKRPVAVMVNNVREAMPQYGIESADVIFEIPVEAGLTRMLAIFADYQSLPNICSVRSYRSYFPAIALGYDAFYIHWGEDMTAMDYYYSLNMDSYDGMSDGRLFGRDSNRLKNGYALEHTSVFYGTKFNDIVTSDGRRTDLNDDYKTPFFNFTDSDKPITPAGDDCNIVNLEYGSMSSTLVCSKDDPSLYYKYINGNIQIDGNTGNQLAFTNVFVIVTNIWDKDAKGRKNMDLSGGDNSTGYYISNGKVQKIHWSKEDEYHPFKFYDENGKELKVNKGKTYLTLVNEGMESFKTDVN